MANNQTIQILRSYANSTPLTLEDGEQAYSFVSKKLFIGNNTNKVITTGGQYYTDIIDAANSQNIPSTLVKRSANGSVDLGRITTTYYPDTNIDVTSKQYVDNVISFSRTSIFFGTFGNTGYSNVLTTSSGVNVTANNKQVARFREDQIYFDKDFTVTGNISIQNQVSTGNISAQNIIAYDQFYAGIATSLATPLPNLIAQFTGNTDSYVQVNVENIDPLGSGDYVATADVGTDTTFYIDLGIQGSQAELGTLKPLDGYLYVEGNTGQPGGNLIIGTVSGTPGLQTRFINGGYGDENVIMTLDSGGVLIVGDLEATTFSGNTIDNLYTAIDTANTYQSLSLQSANTWLQANDASTLAVAKSYTDVANNYLQANTGATLTAAKAYTDTANTFLQANDYTTLTVAKSYTDTSNTFLQANDYTTLTVAKAYTDTANAWLRANTSSANTFLQANDYTTLTVAKSYTDTANAFLQANTGAALAVAKAYTDTANTFLKANDYTTLLSAKSYTDSVNSYNILFTETYTNTANTFLQANDAITLGIALNYTDVARTDLRNEISANLVIAKTYTDTANSFLQANDAITLNTSLNYTNSVRLALRNEIDANLITAKAYTDTANTFLQANDITTLTSAKSYTDSANTWLQANTGAALAAAKVYTDTANTFLQANTGAALAAAKVYTDTANNYNQQLVASANAYVLNLQTYTQSAFAKANSANVLAQQVYDYANTKFDKSGGYITGFANVSSNVSVGTYVDFNTTLNNPTRIEGRLFYDKNQHALSYYNEQDMTLQIGQEHVLRVWNNSGVTIGNGKAVYITSGASANGFSNVALANAATQITSEVIGLATQDIPNGGYGYVTSVGKVNDLNTSLFTEGLELYLSATSPGDYTNTPPAPPAVPINIGYTTVSDLTAGAVYVSIHLMEGVNKTSGSILFARNQAIDEDPTHLFWDYENNSLGIGTGTPAANLHVVGSGLFTGNVIISGNLLVSNAQSITTTALVVSGNTIVLNTDATGAPVLDAQIIVNRGTSANAFIRWNETDDDWFIYRGFGTSGHILDSEETFTSWGQYSTGTIYQKATTPIGADLSNTINELAKTANTVAYTGQAQAIIATNLAQSSYDFANNVYIFANSAHNTANTANTRAFLTALKSGDTFSGNVIVPTLAANTSITVNSIAQFTSTAYVTSSLAQVTLDSFAAATYRSAKYEIQVTSGTKYHVLEVRVLHDGTTAWLNQYGEIWTEGSLGTFSTDVTGGNVTLLFTPLNSSTTVKLKRSTITV